MHYYLRNEVTVHTKSWKLEFYYALLWEAVAAGVPSRRVPLRIGLKLCPIVSMAGSSRGKCQVCGALASLCPRIVGNWSEIGINCTHPTICGHSENFENNFRYFIHTSPLSSLILFTEKVQWPLQSLLPWWSRLLWLLASRLSSLRLRLPRLPSFPTETSRRLPPSWFGSQLTTRYGNWWICCCVCVGCVGYYNYYNLLQPYPREEDGRDILMMEFLYSYNPSDLSFWEKSGCARFPSSSYQ